MKVAIENYKGIEFVRISTLPENQKTLLKQSFDKNKIIKILKENSLLSDCVMYSDYLEWLSKNLKAVPPLLTSDAKLHPILELA
jgi:hypothetical protein